MKMIGLARLGADAEVRYMPNGDPVATVNLAYSFGKDKETQWVKAALFGKRAESAAPYLKKGTQICVTLIDPHIEEWESKDGKKGVTLKATVQDFEFAGSKSADDRPTETYEGGLRKDVKQGAKQPAGNFDNFDDDIPF